MEPEFFMWPITQNFKKSEKDYPPPIIRLGNWSPGKPQLLALSYWFSI